MRRGFIFSVDALLGLGIALAVIGLIIPFSDTTSLPHQEQLHMQRYTSDLLIVLQKGGYVDTALSGDDTSIGGVLALTGSGKCFVFKAIDTSNSNMVLSVTKAGCGGLSTSLSSAVSDEYYGARRYRLELLGWVQ